MAHFAQIDESGLVVQVMVINNEDILDENGQESEAMGQQICNSIFEGTWVQTSYNGTFRRNYAFIGGTYDAQRDAFIFPQPYPSWTLDDLGDWQPPVPRPDCELGCTAQWDEENQYWIKDFSQLDKYIDQPETNAG